MIGLLQRVTSASVNVEGETVGAISDGLLVLVGVESHDDAAAAETLAKRIASYRVFSDADDKMNLSALDLGYAILAVPQFTLAADTRRGRRPSFSSAAPPALGQTLFEHFVAALRAQSVPVETGVFGADMKVQLLNDGPVTFWLQTPGAPG